MSAKIFRLLGLLAFPIAYLLLRPYMVQWAEDWEWAILFLGIFLLGLEVFIIPGFGLAGISAFVLMYAGLVLVMLNNKGTDFSHLTMNEITRALLIGVGLLAVVVIGLMAVMPSILQSRQFDGLTHHHSLDKSQGYVALQNLPKLMGKIGTSETILRPSGKINIDNQLYDATTQGDFIEKGVPITVVGQEGAALRVKKS